MNHNLRLHTIVSEPFGENSYVVGGTDRHDVIVVDPGFEPGLILDYLKNEGLKLAGILNTHGHLDHIAGNRALKQAFPDAPLLIGTADAPMLTDAFLNFSAPYGMPLTSPPADRCVNEGEDVELAGLNFEVFDVPGHSPGHVVYLWRGNPHVLLGGDVLFRGSVGRTDYPGMSFDLLRSGIHGKIWPLPDDTVVYPGHGPVTTVGHEKQTNPFVGAGAG
jgi:glyoxylase-like metal-dependent hydrolase (beta-lactamase superfamily II)